MSFFSVECQILVPVCRRRRRRRRWLGLLANLAFGSTALLLCIKIGFIAGSLAVLFVALSFHDYLDRFADWRALWLCGKDVLDDGYYPTIMFRNESLAAEVASLTKAKKKQRWRDMQMGLGHANSLT